MLRTSLLALVLCAACGGAAEERVAEGPLPDPVVPTPTKCNGLRASQSSAQLAAAVARFVEAVREKSATAYVDGGDIASTTVRHVNVDLPVGVETDPRSAILSWLSSLRDAPVRPAEYAPSPDRPKSAPSSGFTAGFVRTKAGATPFADLHPESLQVSVQANGAVWRISSIQLQPFTFFATEDDARTIRACTPSGPPPVAPIHEKTFRGLELEGCIEVGTYAYRPNERDRIVWGKSPWGERILWTISATGDGGLSWVPQLGAHLIIDPSNHWKRIKYADCTCGHAGTTGFSLIVHAVTGEVLRATPGVNCVVC